MRSDVADSFPFGTSVPALHRVPIYCCVGSRRAARNGLELGIEPRALGTVGMCSSSNLVLPIASRANIYQRVVFSDVLGKDYASAKSFICSQSLRTESDDQIGAMQYNCSSYTAISSFVYANLHLPGCVNRCCSARCDHHRCEHNPTCNMFAFSPKEVVLSPSVVSS